MKVWIKKICLGLIYAGAAVILLAPLFVDNDYFFPFISTRVFIFRPAVEVMLLAYLLLNIVDENYRPRVNRVTVFVALFTLTGFISSLLGNDFYRSFWGDVERGEGIILWLHLLALLLVLTGTFQDKKKVWLGFLDFSVIVAILLAFFGLAQSLKLPFVLTTQGTRVDATFGNAAFFGAYLLFHLAFVAFLFSERRSLFARIYYSAVGLLFAYLIFATETRGAVIGLLAGVLFGSVLYAIKQRGDQRVRRASIAVIIFVLVSGIAVYFLKDSSFVQNSPKLRRLATISLSARTAQTRLATWKAAAVGWKQKLILGWGMENFQEVFNKNFPPIIYEDEGSQVWFDRAHNVIFDRATTTGIVGLVLFLMIFLYPLYRFLRFLLSDPQHTRAAIIFSSFIVTYLIQDLFIFESINIYIILFFTLAFWSMYLKNRVITFSPKIFGLSFAIYALAFTPILWKVNIEPARVNRAATVALHSDPQEEDFFLIIDRFKKAIEPDTYGKQEYRLQFIEFVGTQFANLGEVIPEAREVLNYTDQQVEKQIAKGPNDAKFYLLAMRHYNFTHAAVPEQKEERPQKALSFLPKLQELTPTRPHIYQEAGYSYLYLFRYHREQKNTDQAGQDFLKAEEYFRKAVEIQPKVVESYVNLIMLYLNAGEDGKIAEVIREMDERKVPFRQHAVLAKLFNLSLGSNNLRWAGYFSEEQTKLNPDDVQAWINLAVFYATSGNRPKAIEIAQKIKEFGGDYIRQADLFIESVNKGEYEPR